jgi:uncharacterized GH25 family protein
MTWAISARPTRSAISCALIAIVFIAAVGDADAHDFWIQASSFAVSSRQEIQLALLVGHGDERQLSQVPRRRIVRFEIAEPTGARRNLAPRLADQAGSLALSIALEREGAHMLVLETDNGAYSRLPAVSFNDYAVAEGLSLVQAARERSGRTQTDGSEIYRRCAKAIVRVGEGDTRAITRIYGLALEIVPDNAPDSGVVSARVLFRGHPLAGALVKLTDLDADNEPLDTELTDQHGRVRFVLPRSSSWLLNVVWSTPRPPAAATDFESYFSSLTFAT